MKETNDVMKPGDVRQLYNFKRGSNSGHSYSSGEEEPQPPS